MTSTDQLRAAAERLRRLAAGIEKLQDIYGVAVGPSRREILDACRKVKRAILDDERALIAWAVRTLLPAEPPAQRCTHPDRGATVAVTCPHCKSPVRLPADPVDSATDRTCPVCGNQLPYLPDWTPPVPTHDLGGEGG